MSAVGAGRVNRREVLAAGAAAGAALALAGRAGARSEWSRTIDFGALGDGDAWPGWTCSGVANLRRQGGQGLLEAGSDVFPCDPRPVAFAIDQRFRDGKVAALISATGAGAGVVVRRVGPRAWYAAILDDENGALVLVRRHAKGMDELARTDWTRGEGPVELSLEAVGARPTKLTATARDAAGSVTSVTGSDATAELQRAGDPGVLATARTLLPSSGPAPEPALGNLHLLPYGLQEGEAVMQTAVGQAVLDRIRERSTAAFTRIAVSAGGRPQVTLASVVAATNGAPLRRGGQVRVASDVPARIEVEYALNKSFRHSRRLVWQHTGSFAGFVAELRGLPPGHHVYWRPRLRRRGRTSLGPVRSFRVLPPAGAPGQAKIAIAACASQFGPIFEHLLAQDPDVFVWHGDLNYPDTVGPLAQTMSGYAGIWRDFLVNPRLTPILESALFAPQRDDHDYGVQDANSTNLVPWGLAPWEGLMQPRPYYRFAVGPAEFWVLDQRRWKSAPASPNDKAKTLLGPTQRDWL